MSHAGGNNAKSMPSVPIMFTTNAGVAVPAANNLNVLGAGGITTSGSGSTITITATGFPWIDVTTATQTIAIHNGYVTDRGAGVTYTLPATAVFGSTFRIAGKLGAWTLAQNANQQISLGAASTTVGVSGSLASTNVGDCIELLCTTAGTSTVWRVLSSVGNITVT